MMRRAIGAALMCAAVLAVGAQAAVADVVSKRVVRCEADMTWQIGPGQPGTSIATVTFDSGTATETGCRGQHVGVQDDLDPFLVPYDYASAATQQYALAGPDLGIVDYTYAGPATQVGGPAVGVVTITGGLLTAQLSAVYPDGSAGVAVHTGTSRCGTFCFKTHAVWTPVS